jgi:CMP-N-acetylneuraminic acid synthetase
MKKVTAIVPMKAQSERVRGKNLREFCGKPLFWQIVSTLQEVHSVGKIVVDTDGENIAESVTRYFPDVKIVRRPSELTGHDVSMNRILKHDLSQLDGEHFLQTHSTNPLLTTRTVESAVESYFEQIESGENDSLFSVSRIQARCYLPDGSPINHNPEELIQTQYLKPVYLENSNIYIFSKSSFAKKGRRIGEKPFMFAMDEYEAIDIDTEKDFTMAEILCGANKGNEI